MLRHSAPPTTLVPDEAVRNFNWTLFLALVGALAAGVAFFLVVNHNIESVSPGVMPSVYPNPAVVVSIS